MIKRITNVVEFDAMHQLSCYAFDVQHTSEEKEAFFDYCHHTLNYGDWINRELVSKVMVVPFFINLYGKRVKMGGIGNVSSYPENRGKGSIRRLFDCIFEEMQETEILLSYLDPFSQPFYRKFGYERVVAASTVTIPSQRLHFFSTTGDLKLKRKNKMEQEQLSVGYARTLGKQHGSLERENWWLDYQAGKKECKYALVFDSNDVIVGYLSYHFKDNEYYIEEMGYQTQDALKELLNFVVAHKSSFKLFHFNQCYNTDFLEYFEDTRDITTTVTSSMMARIISFSQFMEHLPLRLPNEVKFYLEVIDENCPWNHGVFSLKTVNDEIKCTKVEEMAEGFPVYRGDISRWTQVLMGYLSLEQALELGFLTSNEKEATLSLYLPSERPVLYDHF